MTEETLMKITDVTLTLFSWESIPSTIYGHQFPASFRLKTARLTISR